MVHTATLTYRIPFEKAYIYNNFIHEPDTVPYKQYDYAYFNTRFKNKGIVVFTKRINTPKFKAYLLICRINFKRLIEQKDKTLLFTESNFSEVQMEFDNCMFLLGELPEFHEWNVNRLDYSINIKTPYVKQYIKLMQKGDLPNSQKMRYDKESRNYAHQEGSVYLPSKARDGRKNSNKTGSMTINFYDKQDQLQKEHESNPEKVTAEVVEQAQDILRLEVQCFRTELAYLKKKYDLPDMKMYRFLDAKISFNVIQNQLLAICKTGDYRRKKVALAMIDNIRGQKKTKEELKSIIKRISMQYQYIWKVRKEFEKNGIMTRNKFKRRLDKLSEYNINPVVISNYDDIDGKTKHEGLPNLYELLLDAFQNEYRTPDIEETDLGSIDDIWNDIWLSVEDDSLYDNMGI